MVYEFGLFRYDPSQRLLFRNGELVPVVPKALETLHVLLERRGTIVEKADLMRLVWPDTNVEEVGLARNISLLRKALQDESVDNPYIETIPRRGYRFTAPVSGAEPAPAVPPPQTRRSRLLLLAVAAPLAAAFAYYQFYVPSPYLPVAGRSASVALVPFECLCPGADGDLLARGLDEILVAELSKLDGVQLVSPSTVRRHQKIGVSMGLMGRLLGLDALVEGTVQTLGDEFRVTARLVDVHTGRVIWSDTYDQPVANPGAAQETAGRAVAAAIGQRLQQSRRNSEAFPKRP